MSRTARFVGVLMAVAVSAGAAYFMARQVQESQSQANDLVDDFEEQLAAMDPLTRAAVMARLSSDGMSKVRAAQAD